MLYLKQPACTWFQLTTLVVISTGCIGSCTCKCHVMTTTTVPHSKRIKQIRLIRTRNVDHVMLNIWESQAGIYLFNLPMENINHGLCTLQWRIPLHFQWKIGKELTCKNKYQFWKDGSCDTKYQFIFHPCSIVSCTLPILWNHY